MTMTCLIGEKEVFGIEYEISSKDRFVMGRMRVWIEGNYLGAFDDLDMLGSAQLQFKDLDSTSPDGCEFVGKSPERICDLIDAKSPEDRWRYVFSPGPSFDDFFIIVYTCNDVIYFVWKLEDQPFFDYPGYPKDVQSAKVPAGSYRKVVAAFGRVISS